MAGILGQVPVGPVLFTGPCLDPFKPASKDFPYRTVRYCDQLEVVRREDGPTGQEGTRRAAGAETKRQNWGAGFDAVPVVPSLRRISANPPQNRSADAHRSSSDPCRTGGRSYSMRHPPPCGEGWGGGETKQGVSIALLTLTVIAKTIVKRPKAPAVRAAPAGDKRRHRG